MLVLSRKKNEKTYIIVPPSDKETLIDVTLVELRGDKARIGIEAPKEVAVHRKEVLDAMQRDNVPLQSRRDGSMRVE